MCLAPQFTYKRLIRYSTFTRGNTWPSNIRSISSRAPCSTDSTLRSFKALSSEYNTWACGKPYTLWVSNGKPSREIKSASVRLTPLAQPSRCGFSKELLRNSVDRVEDRLALLFESAAINEMLHQARIPLRGQRLLLKEVASLRGSVFSFKVMI